MKSLYKWEKPHVQPEILRSGDEMASFCLSFDWSFGTAIGTT